MRILYLDPYHGGSHAAFARGWQRHSRHHIELQTLPVVALDAAQDRSKSRMNPS